MGRQIGPRQGSNKPVIMDRLNNKEPSSFRRRLLRWYDGNRRSLPWRETRDPYAIWLSEVMLQQTTVRTVEPRWRRFLRRWPAIADLAAAPLDDVLHEWTGLGYYARARNLHKAARIVVEEFGGELPGRYELLLALPGMGVYTAAAVASIAFGEAVPVVDANVERVLARLHAVEEDARSARGKRRLRGLAVELMSRRRPGDFNQAMMELGATVCVPKRPACWACPVAAVCGAKALGAPEAFPRLAPRPALEPVREAAVILRRGGKVLLLKRKKNASFGGMWELPRVRCRDDESSIDAAARAARELAGLEATIASPVMRLKHTVMRNRITLLVYKSSKIKGSVRLAEHASSGWFLPEEWLDLPKSTSQTKIAKFVMFFDK